MPLIVKRAMTSPAGVRGADLWLRKPSVSRRGDRRLVLLVAGCLAALMSWAAIVGAQEVKPRGAASAEPGPFGDFDDERDYPGVEELRSILQEVPGQPYEISEKKRNKRPVGHLAGLFRLNLPWPEGHALRLSFWEPEQLRLHLWNGRSGVTLQYHRHFHQAWAAYGTTRDDDQPRPSKRALWATDDGRYRRVGIGTVEVHYREGNLTLARGDLELLRVPLEGPPEEVFLEATGPVRGLAMVPSTVPPGATRSRPVVARVTKPAELDWEAELPEGVSLNKLADGRIELAAGERTEEARASASVCGPGLHEFVLEVEEADAGTGVYLADREGQTLHRLGFFRDRQSGETTFGLLHPSRREIERTHDVQRHVVPYAGRRQWFRVVLGAGVLKYWTSGDGVRWSQIAPTVQPVEGDCRRVGLYCLADEKPRAIKLRFIEVRRLEALESLVPDTVAQQVDLLFEREGRAFIKAESLETWERRVAVLQTPDVEPEVWWRAWALRTLAAGPNLSWGQALLDRLVEKSLADIWQLEEGLQLLEEAALVCHSSDARAVDRWLAHHEALGRRLARRGEPAPFTQISRALIESPLWTDRPLPMFSEWLLRRELFTKIGEDQWVEVSDLCRRLEHWDRTQAGQSPLGSHVRHLAHWAAAQAAGHVWGEGQDKPAGVPLEWRHPLIEQLSREGYNILAELEAALEARAYREACQVISTSAGAEGLGLLPAGADPRLRVSLPLAIEQAMRRHPDLRKTMQDALEPLGALRLKRAVDAADWAAVESIALQFFGTTAAAEANLWLGNRSLSIGRFARAGAHYRQALASAADACRDDVLARLRLAGALEGRDVGSPVTGPVEIGNRRLPAAEFEQLVEATRQARASTHAIGGANGDAAASQSGFLLGRYEARKWAHVDGRRVKRPQAVPDRGFDWAGRQTTVLVTDRQMLVNNQIDQAAFDLSSGRLLWAQRRVVEDRFQQWPLVGMRPLVAGGRVFVRQLADGGPELVALDETTGRMLWSSKPKGHVVSDPLALDESLLALLASYDPGEKLTLWLAGFDPDSGRVVREAPLAEFRDRWQHRLPCRATIAEGRLVASVGGCVLCCDLSGRVAWLRRQIWVPWPGASYRQAPQWFEQVHEAPLVADGRVYATQPGVWGIECLALETGELLWRRAESGLTRPVGLASGGLIVQTGDGLLAVDAQSGKTLWHYGSEHRLEARLCGQPGLILTWHAEPDAESDGGSQFALAWIDAQTGEVREQSRVETRESSGEWLGPLVAQGGRQWAFTASAEDPSGREILEWAPAAEDAGK